MSDKGPLSGLVAIGGLGILQYLIDLFTCGQREEYSRERILVVLNAVKHDPELFLAEDVEAFDAEHELAVEEEEGA